MENGNVMIMSENNNIRLKKWWKGRSKNQRIGIVSVAGLTFGIFIFLIVYFFAISDHFVTCTTPECHAASLEVLGYIDENKNPCDDFYIFACGTFLRNASWDDQQSPTSVKSMMEDAILVDIHNLLEEPTDPDALLSINLAKKFYKACTNEKSIEEQGIKKIKTIFKQMGGWPLLEGDGWNAERFDWKRAVRTLRAFGINFEFFFNVSVDVDRENPERYILSIHNKYYNSPSDIDSNIKIAFLDYMVEVASQFDVKSANVWKEQNEVLEFLLKLAKISEESRKTNRTNNIYNPHTLPELQHEFRTIAWYEYLQGVLGNSATLSFDDIINVADPVYLKKLEQLLLKTNKRVLANFMGWHTIQNLINFLPSNIINKAYEFLRKVNGKYDETPRWKICVEATRERLSSAINVAYIEKYFDEEAKSHATDLIRDVKNIFRKTILMSDWLDEETKNRIVSTLLSSVDKIFSYNDLTEIVEECSVYENVEIEEDKLLKAVLDLDLINWDLHYGLLRKPVKDDWIKTQRFISGLKVEYSASENKLRFPLGLFRGIYYDKSRPDYMNYGLLGSVLSHQISHIFVEAVDVNFKVGESQIAEHKLINWWSPQSLKKFNEKLECLSSQYSKFQLRDLKELKANSLITRDEDFADLSGLKIAYETYIEKEWVHGKDSKLPNLKYSPRQLFWISSALQFCSKYSTRYLEDKYGGNQYHHSPNEFRVNGPLQNLEEFSYDFGCRTESFMNPYKKCYIW